MIADKTQPKTPAAKVCPKCGCSYTNLQPNGLCWDCDEAKYWARMKVILKKIQESIKEETVDDMLHRVNEIESKLGDGDGK